MGGIFSIEARDMDMKLLPAPESNNTLAKCWFRRNVPVTTFGSWHGKLLILSAFLTQRTVSSIPMVFSWSDSIRPEGFLSSVLLWLVIIVAVVGVGVTVVIVIIVAVVVVVESWAYAFHQDKASSVRVPVANVTLFSSTHLLRENTDSFPCLAIEASLGLVVLSVFAMLAACASRAAETLSATSFLMAA
ncbi:hypothetical protein Tco_0444565 [Tanacetum coccineum]